MKQTRDMDLLPGNAASIMRVKHPYPMMAVNLTEKIRKCKWAYIGPEPDIDHHNQMVMNERTIGMFQSSN